MITFLILLAKVFLFGIPYMLLIGLVNVILGNLGRIFARHKILGFVYSLIFTVIFIYLYSFGGAFLKSIIVTYSQIYSRKWLLVVLCFISIYPYYKYTHAELYKEGYKL